MNTKAWIGALIVAFILQVLLIHTGAFFIGYVVLLCLSVWFVLKAFKLAPAPKTAAGPVLLGENFTADLNYKSIIYMCVAGGIFLSLIVFKNIMPVPFQVMVIVLGILTVFLDRKQQALPGYKSSKALDIAALLIVVAVAAAGRFYAIGEQLQGVNGDEMVFSRNAIDIMKGNFHPPAFISGECQIASPSFYLLAFFYKVFGVSLATLHLSPALYAVLSVAAFYIFLRLFFRTDVAFLASMLFATNHVYIHVSRWMHILAFTPFFVWAGMGLAVYGFVKRNRLALALAGLITAWSLYFYNSNKFVVVIIGLYIGYELLRAKFEKRYENAGRMFSDIAVFGICFILALMPLLDYIIFNWNDYTYYLSFVSVKDIRVIQDNIVRYLGMLTVQGTENVWLNDAGMPLLNKIETVLFLLGLGIAVVNIRQRVSVMALLLLFAGLLPGVFTNYWAPPSTQRGIIAFSASYLIMAFAINALMTIGKGYKALITRVFVAVIVWGSCMTGVNTYFVKMINDPLMKLSFSPLEFKLGKIISQNRNKYSIFWSRYYNGGTGGSNLLMGESIYFYSVPKPPILDTLNFSVDSLLMFPYDTKDVMLLVDSFYRDSYDFLLKRFPNAKMTLVKGDPFTAKMYQAAVLQPFGYDNTIQIVQFEIPGSDIDEMAGLRFYDINGNIREGKFGFNAVSGTNIKTAGVFKGSVRINSNGNYIFKLQNFKNPQIKLNGNNVILTAGISRGIKLFAGFNNIEISVSEVNGNELVFMTNDTAPVDLKKPVEYGRFVKEWRTHGFRGKYTQYEEDGSSKVIREDLTPTLYQRWFFESMEGRVWKGGFAAYMIGDFTSRIKIDVPGEYEFGIAGTGQEAKVYIDGKQVFKVGWIQAGEKTPVFKKIYLGKGFHDIKIWDKEYNVGTSTVCFMRTPDGKTVSPIPEDILFPR